MFANFEDATRLCVIKAQERAKRAGRVVCDTADIALAVLVPFDGVLPVFAREQFPTQLSDSCAAAMEAHAPDDGPLDTSCLSEVDRIARAEAARRRSPSVAPEHLLLAVARMEGPGRALLLACGVDYEELEGAIGSVSASWPPVDC